MKKLKDVWNELPDLEYTKKYIDEKTGLKIYEVCGRKFQETVKIEYILDCLKKVEVGYGSRVREAKENKVDFKAVSHAIRAAFQVREILTDNTITFPLKEKDLILGIKSGKYDYLTFVAPLLENLMEEVEELSKNSNLPEKVDRKWCDKLLVDIIEDYYDFR